MSYCAHPKEELRPIAPGRYFCGSCGADDIWGISIQPAACYIAGPMTGHPGFNYHTFNSYAARLRTAGWGVINPTERHDQRTDLPYVAYLRGAVCDVLRADAVAVLPGWESSQGARLEVAVARILKLPLYDADARAPLAPEHLDNIAAREKLAAAVAELNAMEIAPLLYMAERTRMGRHIYGPKGRDESRDMLAELLAELADGVNYLVWAGDGRKQHGTEQGSG